MKGQLTRVANSNTYILIQWKASLYSFLSNKKPVFTSCVHFYPMRNQYLPAIYILIQWEASPISELVVKPCQPIRGDSHTWVQDELGEECVQLIILDKSFFMKAHDLIGKGQLFLQQEIGAEVPARFISLLSLTSYQFLDKK